MNWESLPPEWNESVICLLTYSQYIPFFYPIEKWKSPASCEHGEMEIPELYPELCRATKINGAWRIRNAKQLTPYRKHT